MGQGALYSIIPYNLEDKGSCIGRVQEDYEIFDLVSAVEASKGLSLLVYS